MKPRPIHAGAILALGLLAAACRASAVGGPERVDLEALPADYAALLEAYDEGGEVWLAARAEALDDPGKARFLVDNISAHMVRSFETASVGSHRAKSFPFERAQSELVLMSEHSLPLLIGMVATDDGVLAHLGGETCARIGEPAIDPCLELFSHPRDQVRRRAVELVGRLPRAGEQELELVARLAAVARDDEAWVVRAQAARALGERAQYQERIGALREALEATTRDEDSTVVAEAAKALGVVGDRSSVPTLLKLLERSLEAAEAETWTATQQALVALAGGGPQRDLDDWRRWWRDVRHEERPR